MKRQLLDSLINWQNKVERKPILIDGARQTGKTYLLRNLFGQRFNNVVRIDFLERPSFAEAFENSLTPQDIISSLELLTEQVIDPTNDLVIFDEIGECPRAVTSLKYFAEQTPHYFIAASGSNIGLLNSFPVGKVEQHYLRPLSFKEYLWATEQPALIKAFEERQNSAAAHTKLMEQLTDYYFTGGMPEAVSEWFRLKDESILTRIEAVSQIHANLIEGYQRDFGKYSGQIDAQLIEAVFNAIPAQLASVVDESVKRFRFKDVYGKKSRYADFENAIAWLHRCRLTLLNYPIEGRPQAPLAAYKKDNRVKLYLFDTGLLNHMLGSSYREIKNQAYDYKGYIAENFVQQEFAVGGLEPSFGWSDARAEIEFIVSDDSGQIIPVEVKSGTRTRAKSLLSYKQRYSPERTIKLSATQGSALVEKHNIVRPLYYVETIFDLLSESSKL